MKKVLFLIHDLMGGGAEKVLVNLVNNMDYSKFDVTVMSLFDVGVNRQYLKEQVHYKYVYKRLFRGNQHYMKLFTSKRLHEKYIKEHYDIEVAYLEGACTRIISGCPYDDTKLVSWVHIVQNNKRTALSAFRSINELETCYNRFNKIICVSQTVLTDFLSLIHTQTPIQVLFNTNESNKIRLLSQETLDGISFIPSDLNVICVGKLNKNKGFDKVLRIVNRLKKNGYNIHLFVLGVGELISTLENYIEDNQMDNIVDLVGYEKNPYKYIARCDLFVCASLREGFSTAATEALIVGTPVCTVDVSGMKEMLGENNEYGVVTENNEEALYEGIKMLLDNPDLLAHYKKQAEIRGKEFSTEKTVKAVEDMLLSL